MIKTRQLQIKKAAQEAYYASRRPRPPVITQVPSGSPRLENGRRVQSLRPVLVPHQSRPIDWEQAREIGKAYARVLDGEPKYDRKREAEIVEEHNKAAEVRKKLKGRKLPRVGRSFKGITIQRREHLGEWWLSRLAERVERRLVITRPSAGYCPREVEDETPGTEAPPES